MPALRRYSDFFGGTVPWYSIFAGIAVAAMGVWLYRGLKREFGEGEEDKVLACFPLAICFGIVTAAAFDAVSRGTWRTWGSAGAKEFGFAFFGWAAGVLAFAGGWGAVAGIGAKRMVDFFAPSLALAQGFGRIGCFLGGCCYGCPSEKYGLRYPPGSLPYETVGDVALFPVQLLESALLFVLFGVCAAAGRRRGCAVYLIGVSANRFFLEYLRHDDRGSLFGQSVLSPSQIASMLLFFVGAAMLPHMSRGRRRDGAAPRRI